MYSELHCKTNFSFLEGASHAEELARRAQELEYAALAITDRNSLAGVVRAHGAAKDIGLKLLIGAELQLEDATRLLIWVTDRSAYGRLARLLTAGRRRAEKGECRLNWADVAEHADGLLAGACLPDGSLTTCSHQLQRRLGEHRELFGDRGYLMAELHRGVDDRGRLDALLKLARASDLPLVAAGDVHYHVAARKTLHDVLTAIRHGVSVTEAGDLIFPNAQRHLKRIDEIQQTFAATPDAVERTREIAERCHFSLDELRFEYPVELAPEGLTPFAHLSRLAWRGATKRYPRGVPEKVRTILQHELELIEQLQYEAYFLTVWDLVRFARSRGILCQGRGSAANSAVCFCLGVTSVDPNRTDVLFERFVSRERNEAPDIDVDFEHERREEVLQYLYEKYGRERAGMTAVVITYRSRSAIRDAGKALGLSLDCVDALAKQVEGYAHEPKLAERCQQVGIDPASKMGRRLVEVVNQLIGFPRHLSQHVGGMVITQGPLCELSPIENAAMEGRTVIQWDKDDLDELGILKVDCLSLGMLTAIRKGFEMIDRHYDRKLSLATVPAEDPRVYDMICRADTMGVFQIESRAQMSMLPRLKPRCYYDLVIEVAIVRPGPIQGQMVHPYLRRRAGEEQVTYPTEEIREVLNKTLGVPLFQEQAMRLAVVAAGFTPGEADQLRRAMGAWRRPGVIDQFRIKLTQGMRERGLSEKFAEQVFQQIRGFGEYGFPESHAASFALLVYVSAWMKCFYPEVFLAALINSQPMGFYAPSQLVRDARDHNVEVRPIDANASQWDCTLETRAESDGVPSYAVRLGFRLLNGLPLAAVEALATARTHRPFDSVEDFSLRTKLGQRVIERLAQADVFQSLGRTRRTALWESLVPKPDPQTTPLFQFPTCDEPTVELPEMGDEEEVFADYQATGLSLRAHPLSFHREQLDEMGVTPAQGLEQLANNRHVCVAGIVILRQRPSTAKGITFVTLEDETGVINLVVRQTIWERYYQVARRSAAWLAYGKLETRDSVIHVVIQTIEDLSSQLGELRTKSRDFR